jgi:hypothetical protein
MPEPRRSKKKPNQPPRQISSPGPDAMKRKLTPEEKARIIRDRLASRPVIAFRYPNGRLNRRFIIMLTILVAAMVVALYFLSRI